MSNSKYSHESDDEINAADAQELCQQLANRISNFSDEELENISIGSVIDTMVSTIILSKYSDDTD